MATASSIITASNSLATQGDEEILKEAAAHFFHEENVKFSKTTGGVNNICQYLETSTGEKYIIRVYNNGFNTERVEFEHELLDKLNQVDGLSFKVPTFLPTKSNTISKTYAVLSNGMACCLCEIIPGTLPKLSCAKAIGKACGELVVALSKIEMNRNSPNPIYYNIYDAHHATNKTNFGEYIQSSSLDVCREPITYLVNILTDLEVKLQLWKEQQLPEQLIHADLHYLNVLVEDDKVTACLDFEFAVRDWRAMELAVSLSKYAGEKEGLQYFSEMVSGFAEYVKLTENEINAIVDLVNVRILSNVIYFVGRAIAGEDDISSLTTRAQMYADRVAWLINHRDVITEDIRKSMNGFGG